MIPNPPHENRERGAGMIEYALLVAFVALALIVGVTTLGQGVSSSITAAANAFGEEYSATTTTVAVNQQKDVETDEAGDVRFEEVGGQVRFGDITPADGWSAKVTKDNGTRATVRFTNTESGERVVVTGWITKKGLLKTRVK